MLLDTVSIGDRLEISLNRDGGLDKSYVSQVEEIIDESELLIHMPISYGQLVRLSLSSNYSLLFFTERGMTRYDAKIIEYTKENGLNFMRVKLLNEGERIQRREFFRYLCLLPLKFTINLDDNKEKEDNKDSEKEEYKPMDGIIKDLSAGGIRFSSNESVEEGMELECSLLLRDDHLKTTGLVLHKQFFPKSNSKYQYRVQFTEITSAEQERIAQYIFNEQKRDQSRGLR